MINIKKIFYVGAVLACVLGTSVSWAADPVKKDFVDPQFEEFEEKAAKPVKDPLRGYNKFMYHFNDKMYFWLFKPLALGYSLLIPEPVRVAVRRSYTNLAFPVRFTSSLFQGNVRGAGREVGRLVVNSTLGIGGLFDPAQHWMNMSPSDEDFGQMLGRWGFGTGFPLVLPLLGQSNLRDGIGLLPNSFVSPVYYVTNTKTYLAVTAGGYFNTLSLHVGDYEKIKKEALDPYTFIRDAHLQNREKKVRELQ